MIVCPACGRSTVVVETRVSAGGSRRRRKCAEASCAGRVTTIEVVVDRHWANEIAQGRAVLVPSKLIAQLQQAIAALGGTT